MTIMTLTTNDGAVTELEGVLVKHLEQMFREPPARKTVPEHKLPEEIKAAWLAALRSPLYQQVRGAWSAGTAPTGAKLRCAMGVLDDVMMNLRGQGIIGLGCSCPEHVESLGTMLGMQPAAFEELTHTIIGQNDTLHYSFERIARYIEAKW